MLHSSKSCAVHMCEQCSAATEIYVIGDQSEVLPGWCLVRATQDGNFMKKGDWGLVESDVPTFIFSQTPTPNKFWGLPDEELDLLPDEEQEYLTEWDTAAGEFSQTLFSCLAEQQYRLHYETMERLVVACKAKGWKSEESNFADWLFNYLGTWLLVAKAEK